MTTIAQALTYPNGTPVDGLLVKIDKVWGPPKPVAGKFGPTSVQNISLIDVAGNKIRCSVWGKPDLTPNTGYDVAIQSVNGKGLKVVHKPWNDKNGVAQKGIELEISKDVSIQLGAQAGVGAQATPPASQQTPIPSIPSPSGAIRGEKVGCALNNAVNSLVAEKIAITKKSLWERASLIILVGNQLEAGNLYSDKPVAAPVATPPPPPPVNVPHEPAPADDVPYDDKAFVPF